MIDRNARSLRAIGYPCFSLVSLLLALFAGLCSAQLQPVAPNDGWMLVGAYGRTGGGPGEFSSPSGIDVAPNGEVYVCDNGSGGLVNVFTPAGALARSWPARAYDIKVEAAGTVLVCYDGLFRHTSSGTLVALLAGSGTAAGQFGSGARCAVDVAQDGRIFAASAARSRILRFAASGAFETEWSFAGLPGVTGTPTDLAVGADSRVYALFGAGANVVVVFDAAGQYIETLPIGNGNGLDVLGGRIVLRPRVGLPAPPAPYERILTINNLKGELLGSVTVPGASFSLAPTLHTDGRLYVIASYFGTLRLLVFEPGFATTGAIATGTSVPVVEIVAVAPRAGTTLIDVDYRVVDPDSATLTTAPIGFRDGVRAIANLVPVRTFVEGTAANVGANIATGVVRRFTWDVSQDYTGPEPFIPVKVGVLASDNRGVLDLQFVTLPANVPAPGDPELPISVFPISDDDFVQAWIWLVASNDAAVAYANGAVVGTGAQNGIVYANASGTTAAGRDFLFARVGVRAATTLEVDRARAGTTPGIQSFVPQKRVANRPLMINEVGVDVAVATGSWVVKL